MAEKNQTELKNCPDCRALAVVTAKRHCPETKPACTWKVCSCGATYDKFTGVHFNPDKK